MVWSLLGSLTEVDLLSYAVFATCRALLGDGWWALVRAGLWPETLLWCCDKWSIGGRRGLSCSSSSLMNGYCRQSGGPPWPESIQVHLV